MSTMLMWDKYDNKYRDVVDVKEVEEIEADLYEANNRINDLLDIVKQKDKEIDLMAERIKEDLKLEYGITDRSIEQIKKHYEERCK